jgi:glycosyltransferase involved in cell wall biosynthesis
MGMKARLAICIGAFEYGGQGTVVEQELLHLKDRFDLTLVAEKILRPPPPGVSVHEISSWGFFPRTNPILVSLLRRFELVHCHDSMGMMLAAQAARKPFVVTSHGIAPLRLRPTLRSAGEGLATLVAYRRLYRSADVVVAISGYIARWLRQFAGVEAALIPNGVNDVVMARPSQPSRRRLLYVGEVSRRKGIRDLIDGLQYAPSDVTLDLVGKGPIEPFKAEALRLNLGDRVRFRGILDATALLDAYRTAFSTCSASFWEGFGLPILEGFSFGRPSIVRAQGGLLELVEESGAGCHFRKTMEIADCVETITQDWEQLSARAIAFASRHTWRQTFDAYAALFQGFT